MKFEFDETLSRADSLNELLSFWKPKTEVEVIPLDQAYGRVAAEDIYATHTLPVVRSSAMDGIAVRSADFAHGMPDTSCWQRDVDWAQADTGDDFPDEFDAVVAIERVEKGEDGSVRFVEDIDVKPGTNVRPSGHIVNSGSLVVSKGTTLRPDLVAACAVAGLHDIKVIKRPVVAFIPTGSELVPWGSYPQRGQNIEANSLLVGGMVREWGADFITYPIVRDMQENLEAALDRALAIADIVIINGGSSRGEEDYNSQLLQARAEHFRHGVRAVPGRPIGMAIIDSKACINMPGPVAAAFLCTDWLIRGLVAHYLDVPSPARRTLEGRLGVDQSKPEEFEKILRVKIEYEEDVPIFVPVQNLGVPQTLAQTDAIVTLPIGTSRITEGETVIAELL